MWDKITAGFDLDDQTANFGTRSLAESDGSVYEATTLATIQAGGDVTEVPQVIAKAYPIGGMCIAVDKSMTVFSDERCLEIQLNIVFESVIDCFTITNDGSLLLVGVRGGDIYCLHIPTQGRLVFSKNVQLEEEDDECFRMVHMFCRHVSDYSCDLVIFGSKGQIRQISEFKFKSISDAVARDTSGDSSSVSDSLNFKTIPNLNFKMITSFTSGVTIDDERNGLVCGGDGVGIMSDISFQFNSFYNQKPLEKVKKIELFDNGNMLLLLTGNSQLAIICPFTLLILKMWKDLPVIDFTICPQSTTDQIQEILVLTMSEDCQHSWLQLVSLPNFEIKLRLKVSSVSHLVSLSSDQQEILYVEGMGSEIVDTFHVKTLMESTPAERFERILRRKKYDEAEKYARLFNLDMELVFKARARQCVEDLGPWSKQSKDSQLCMNQLLLYLDQIKDSQFVCDLCLNSVVSDLSVVRSLMSYAKKRLSTSKDDHVLILMAQLCATEFRLETFEIIDESGSFEEWVRFANSDLLKECQRLLQQGELQQASFIWTRHLCDFKHALTKKLCLTLLHTIPPRIPTKKLMLWLRHFVPTILTVVPEVMDDVIEWGMRTARAMELDRSSWPESALDCAQQLLDLLKIEKNCDVKISFFHHYSVNDSATHKLIALIKAFKQLTTLKVDHQIYIDSTDFLNENKHEVVTTLLDHVTVKNLDKFVTEFVTCFTEEWEVDSDAILRDYISNLVRLSGGEVDDKNEAPWEAVVRILLPHINKDTELLESILAALKASSVPWSQTVHEIANRGLKLNHSLTAEITNQQKLIGMKIVLKKYNFRKHNIDKFDYKIFLSYVRHIVKQNRDDMLEDCLELCGNVSIKLKVDIYAFCFEHFIQIDDEYRAFQVLDQLDPIMTVAIIRKIIYKITCNWHTPHSDNNYSRVLDSLASRLQKSSSGQKFELNPMKNVINELQNLYRLRDEHDHRMGTKEYSSKSKRAKVLQSCTTELLSRTSNGSIPHCKVQRLAAFLKLLPEEGLTEMAKQASERGLVDLAVKALMPLPSVSHLPYHFDHKMYDVSVMMMDVTYRPTTIQVAQVVQEIALNACVHCDGDRLKQWLKLSEWCCVTLLLVNNCSSQSAKVFDQPAQSVDRLNKWSFSPIYFDPVVCSDKSLAVALVSNLFRPDTQMPTQEILQTSLSMLQAVNHDLTALKVICSVSWLTDSADSIALGRLWDKVVSGLLQKVTSARQLDVDLGLGLLTSMRDENVRPWLNDMTRKYQQDVQKLDSVAQLGQMFFTRKHMMVDASRFGYLRKQCAWAKRVIANGMPSREAFNVNEKPAQFLAKLISKPELVSLDLIKEFCDDFSLEIQDYLLVYLKLTILSWEPVIKIQEELEPNARKLPIIENEDVIGDQCGKILKEIEDQSTVCNMLDELWDEINYYNYEAYLAVYDLKIVLSSKNKSIKTKCRKMVLLFLTTYARVCPAENCEKEKWLETFPDSHGLPPMSEWRLPYHQFVSKDAWSVVRPEVTLDSYEIWLSAASIIGLDPDAICSIAIKQSIGQVVPDRPAANKGWCLYVRDPLLMDKISRCVDKLTSPSAASSTLFYVVINTPPGADQINAAQLCFKHASTWVKTDQTPDVIKAFGKVQAKFLELATTHRLHIHGLGAAKYLKLALQPAQLIVALYNDPSVVTRGREVVLYCPNINDAVDDVADIHSLNVTKLRLELVAECLKPSTPLGGSMDDTCTNILQLSPEVDPAVDDDNLLRACYILEAGDLQISANYLISIGFGQEIGESSEMQLRALKCLVTIASEDLLEEFTGRTIASIRAHMQSLNYVVELSGLGLSYSCAGFESCNKLELMKMMWHSYSRSRQALIFMTRLCFDYDLFQTEIWDSVLEQMARLEMVSNLVSLLPKLTEHSHISSSAGYVKAWDCVLLAPFSAGDVPLTHAQERACIQQLVLLQSCPVLCNVNLSAIVEQCVRVRCRHLGATVLPFMRFEQREANLTKLLESSSVENIIDTINRPEYQELLSVAKAVQILTKNGPKGL